MPPEVIALLHELVPIIYDRYGLRLRASDLEGLTQLLHHRWRSGSSQTWATYRQLLLDRSPCGQQAWQPLINVITNTESYFFRDRGQFSLLQRQILPELILSRQGSRRLCLWSAACAGGEEPYSLAIALQGMLPAHENWQVRIFATDINEEALDRARSGRFRSWSFRAIDPTTWQTYFRPLADGWQIDPAIQRLVTFQNFNLVNDELPLTDVGKFDLILCRNVFIYFATESITQTVDLFAKALAPGGYLLTGHAELCHQPLQSFATQIYPESVIYRRRSGQAAATPLPPINGLTQPYAAASNLENPLGNPLENTTGLKNGMETLHPAPLINADAQAIAIETAIANHQERPNYSRSDHLNDLTDSNHLNNSRSSNPRPTDSFLHSLQPSSPKVPVVKPLSTPYATPKNQTEQLHNRIKQKLLQLLKLYPNSSATLYALACLHANWGASQEANQYCQQALEIEPESTEICCLLARIWEEQNQFDQAKQFLRRAVYLDRHALPPRLELASLYERIGDATAARRLYASALELLQDFAPHWPVFDHDHLTARELSDRLKEHLATISHDQH